MTSVNMQMMHVADRHRQTDIHTKTNFSGTSEYGPLYYGNLHNVDKMPQSQIVPCSLLYIATSE